MAGERLMLLQERYVQLQRSETEWQMIPMTTMSSKRRKFPVPRAAFLLHLMAVSPCTAANTAKQVLQVESLEVHCQVGGKQHAMQECPFERSDPRTPWLERRRAMGIRVRQQSGSCTRPQTASGICAAAWRAMSVSLLAGALRRCPRDCRRG